MRKLLRRLLGLDKDWEDMYNHFHKVENQIRDLDYAFHGAMIDMMKKLRVQNEALAKVLVKLDPILAKPDVPPTPIYSPEGTLMNKKKMDDWAAREAESDRLGREAIARLEAEDWARRRTLGEI